MIYFDSILVWTHFAAALIGADRPGIIFHCGGNSRALGWIIAGFVRE